MGTKLTHTGQMIKRYFYTDQTGMAVCVLWCIRVLQWTQFTVIHTFLSPSPCTNMVDSMELEHGVTTSAKVRELPRLRIGIIPS